MQSRLPRPSSPRSGFTLIELLIVIAIIGILASLALPAFNGAMKAAQKAQANALMSNLKVAITGFNTEYGTWPLSAQNDDLLDNGRLYHALLGDETGSDASYGNTRQIPFMEFSMKDLGTASPGQMADRDHPPAQFVDPWWKKTGQNYNIQVDGTYDNQIIPTSGNKGEPPPQTTAVNAGVIIWDAGPPKSSTTVNNDTSKYLKTW